MAVAPGAAEAGGETGAMAGAAQAAGPDNLRGPLFLIGLLWLLGLSGLVVPEATWLALLLYGLGSLALGARQSLRHGSGSLRLSGGRWQRSLLLGSLLGAALSAIALAGFSLSPPPTSGFSLRSLLPLPALVAALGLLVLVEELLWRGLLAAALSRAGRPDWQVLLLTTGGYALNHLAVAPLPWPLRWGLVAMALPIGLANGWLSQATGSLWGGVVAHAMPMLLMVLRSA